MTTEDFYSNKKSFFTINSSNGGEYNNFNLNQNCPDNPFKSLSNNVSPFGTMKLDSGNNYDTFENQYKLSKKNNPNFRQKESTDLELWKTDYGKNSWKKSTNSSTTKALSIHISCYENAKVNDDTFNALADNLSKTKFGIGSSEKVVNLYSIALPFEFPRQKDDSMPERMQFQASQKLLNPNLPPSVGIVSPAKIPEEAQNQDAEISAETDTIARWNGAQFVNVKDGSKTEIQFIFEEASFSNFGELDPVSLEFTAGVLHVVYVNGEKEIVKALRLTSEQIEIIVAAGGYNGPYSSLLQISNHDDGFIKDSPTNLDVFSFLVNYKKDVSLVLETPVSAAAPKRRKLRAKKSESTEHLLPKAKKVKSVSNEEIERGVLRSFQQRLAAELSSLSEPIKLSLPLELLIHDLTLRSLSQSNVEVLFDQMVRGLWQHDQCFFIVHKPRGAEKYSILNGNHRFTAMDKFNKAVEADKRFKEVICLIYTNLDFNQILLVNSQTLSPLPHAPLTVLQKLRLVLKALEQNGLPLICGSTNDEDLYRPIMEMYFKHYPEVCTQLLKLPESTIANLFEVRCSDIPLEQIDVAPDFWMHFLNAAKKNLKGALQLLPSLGEKSAAGVIKLWKKLDVDLLAFMSERGPHDYTNEEDAIEDMSDGKAEDKKSLLKYFKEIRIDHNKGRDKGNYDWVVIKAKLQSHIKLKALFPNATFCNTISDASLHEMDLVISQNSTASVLAKIDIYCKNAVVILLGNFGEGAPVLPTSLPTAVFDVLVEKPVLITAEFTTLPKTSIKASLYLPGSPNESELTKMKFLSKKAMEKGCALGSVMSLEESHCLASFADHNENAAICNVSLKIAGYLLSSLSYFSNLIFTGEMSLQDLVAKATPPETATSKSTPPETEASTSTAPETVASANSVGNKEANPSTTPKATRGRPKKIIK